MMDKRLKSEIAQRELSDLGFVCPTPKRKIPFLDIRFQQIESR